MEDHKKEYYKYKLEMMDTYGGNWLFIEIDKRITNIKHKYKGDDDAISFFTADEIGRTHRKLKEALICIRRDYSKELEAYLKDGDHSLNDDVIPLDNDIILLEDNINFLSLED